MKLKYSNFKNIINYISHIKDLFPKINNLKNSISKTVIFNIVNNFDIYFGSYILSSSCSI